MSAPNFNNDQLGFPLYCREDFYSKVCPECGCWNMASADECEDCGENLENEEPRYDEYDNRYYYDEVWEALRRLNPELDFFQVSIESGYYTGTQLDVSWKYDRNRGIDMNPEDLDNDDAHYYFDCCRSEMLKRYKRERRKLTAKLKELADFHGFEEYACLGVFSNGEAVYRKVEPPKEMSKKQKYAYKAKLAAQSLPLEGKVARRAG